MKKLKLMALVLAAGLSITIANQANAEIGYLNYQKVLDNYPAAQQAVSYTHLTLPTNSLV